ncbi:MAG: nodulation protein NfeD [Proteobacteria bacterium]|nr:nodulation protein NfeD [Pseudomonadota bacterium]
MRRIGLTLLLLATVALAAPALGTGDDDDSSEIALAPPVDPGPGSVLVARLEVHTINRGSKEYLLAAMDRAESDPEIRALVIIMDTPGGVLEDTRRLVIRMLASETPIITYVGPTGSRAASAGLFLTMAGHVAAMAPGTHTGAAHPVFLGPSQGDDGKEATGKSTQQAMLDKVTEDTVSFIHNIADIRGRNGDWGERAVRESVTVTEDEAIELKVVDLVATSLTDLLAQTEGREVELSDGKRTILRTTGPVIEQTWPLRLRVLYLLTEPSIAYLLLMGGLLGLGIELRNPGLFVPGIVGATCLLLGLFSLSALPVNAVAFLFVLVGAGLVIADLFIPTYGLMTIGGVVALAFGGLFLIEETPEVPVGVSPITVGVVASTALVLGLLIGWLLVRDRDRKVYTGDKGILGARGRMTKPSGGGPDALGRVFVQSERWQAWSAEPIEEGVRVVVRSKDGMILEVAREQAAEG